MKQQLISTLDPLTRNLTLFVIASVAFSLRLFSVVRYESVIHEFDPWFNYRATEYLVQKGWREFLNWWDEKAWYPLGRAVGVTVYPGMMLTAAAVFRVLNGVLHANDVKLRDVCVMMAPAFSGLTTVMAFMVGREIKDELSGLIAATMMAIVPGYISRSVAGSYDYEGIAITVMMAMFYGWLRAVRTGKISYSLLTALLYYYMAGSWGGYVFPINLIPLHAITLLLSGQYDANLYTAYSCFYVFATLSSLTIPFIAYQPVSTSEHMAAMGTFCVLQLVWMMEQVKRILPADKKEYEQFRRLTMMVCMVMLTLVFIMLAMTGKIAPFAGRFYSLYDTSYARKHIPIIASVSEHQPTAFGSFFFDLHNLLLLAPVGLAYCAMRSEHAHLFVMLWAVTSSYFAAVMVRLVLTMAPVWCLSAAVGVSWVVDCSGRSSTVVRLAIVVPIIIGLVQFARHSTWITSNAYSSPSIIMISQDRIIDDFREAYSWLRHNTDPDAKILSWWDYGYQMAGMADRTTIVDNNTWNNTHIATVGLALASPEPQAYSILKELDVDYVLAWCGAVSGFAGDDVNKFLWMVRIAQGVFPDRLREADYYTKAGEYRVDQRASEALKQSLLYKMSYYRLPEIMGKQPVDRARQVSMVGVDPQLHSLTEAYSTENYIVRIFKVKREDVLGRRHWHAIH